MEKKKAIECLALFRAQQQRINSSNNILRELDITSSAEVELGARLS